MTLLIAIHCHQPEGNFGFVFEEAFAKAYDPFLRVLERHPGVRLALHYSGCLVDWLLEHRPAFLERVRALVNRGQVELLASGYYEPILPLIPEADRLGQIAKMRAMLRARYRANAEGFWLTERVWEPDLPLTLARAGIRYTMVDTNQFALAKAWLPSALQVSDESFWDLLGCYVTEHAGHSIVLFPASKRLRYWMPFQPVEQTIEFFRRLEPSLPRDMVDPASAAITFADDGEKFGLWPSTHHWVYEEGWLDQFFTALEREREWLTTTTFHDYLERARPNGRVYLPSGSYEEMLEWSGGHFRNFFAKYPEANAMYQKMLHVSHRLQEVSSSGFQVSSSQHRRVTSQRNPKPETRNAKLLDLYLAYLRRAVYARLIAAEALTRQAAGETVSLTALDADGDGREEAILKTPAMALVIDPEEGGTVTEWSLYQPRLNLLDTLSRRVEPYHDKLRAKRLQPAGSIGKVPASIHDLLGVKEPDLAARLVYDDHRRSAFIDYALERMPSLQEVVTSTWGEQRLWSSGPYRRSRDSRGQKTTSSLSVPMERGIGGGCVRKTIRVAAREPLLECLYELEGMSVPVVGLEFNLSLRDERYLGQAGELPHATQFIVEEAEARVRLHLSIDPPARLLHFPIETVSESEGGLERTYQGLCVVCLWTVDPPRPLDGRGSGGAPRRLQGRPDGGRTGRWASRLRWVVEAR
ncbi:MAG: DUF1926 domain-containing protein [Candidatus Omnitrophica bacterium]|nr:DUF1926 domain-containing protein [Candidatus Omnitrophota bacterium]